MIGTITVNPSIDHHIVIDKLVKDDAIRALETRRDPGGKGINVSRAVKELGGETAAFGVAGGCAGYMLKSLMAEKDIPFEAVELPQESRINVIITDRSDGTQTRISATGPRMSLADIDLLVDRILARKPAPDWWVLGGNLPPGAPNDLYVRLIRELQGRGAKCLLDADDEVLKFGVQANPYLIKPNEYEFERLVGRSLPDEGALLLAAREVALRGVQVVALTLGRKGALVVTPNQAFRASTPPVEVKSKVGAGDSFLAGCVLALSQGRPLEEALRLAMAAGAAAVMNDGTQLCRRQDVERLVPQVRIEAVSIPTARSPQAPRRELVRDVVCGMEVDPSLTAFKATRGAQEFHFCSLKCQQFFLADERRTPRP